MKILLLVDCFFPSRKSAPRLMNDLAIELVNRGHVVTVCSIADDLRCSYEKTELNLYTFLKVRAPKFKGEGRVKRALVEMCLSAIIWWRCKEYFIKNPHDLIIFYSPTIFFSNLVKKLKNIWQAKSYLVLRDLFPQWAIDAGILNNGLLVKYFRRKELDQYEVADVVGVQSPANVAYFNEKSSYSRFKVRVLHNWMTPFDNISQSKSYREALGLEGKVIFFFGGNIGIAQDISNLLRLAQAMQSYSVAHFLIVGDGDAVCEIENYIENNGSNITYLKSVDQDEYFALLNVIDVGLITLSSTLKTHNIPGKLLGYMNCEKPILASVNPDNDLVDLINKNEIGLASINGDESFFLKHALKLLNEPLLRRSLAQNAKQVLHNRFSTASAVDAIFRQLEFVNDNRGLQ